MMFTDTYKRRNAAGERWERIEMYVGAAMMRSVCASDAIAITFDGLPEMAGDLLREQMGVHVLMGNKEVSLQFQLLFWEIYAIIAIIVSAWISKGHKLKDR